MLIENLSGQMKILVISWKTHRWSSSFRYFVEPYLPPINAYSFSTAHQTVSKQKEYVSQPQVNINQDAHHSQDDK